MTVSSTTNQVTRLGNGVATSFSFPFTIYASTELVVVKVDSAGAETTLSEGTGATNYSVVVASYPGSGSITYPASGSVELATGESLVIRRKLALTQPVDLENQGGYNPETQEKAHDRAVIRALQQQGELDRAIKIPVSDSGISTALPIAATRASKTFIFDADGNPGVGSATSTAISAAMEAVVTASTLAAARTALGTPSANDSGVLNATLHSTPMNGDGSTDNKAAWASCLTYCAANDLDLYIPAGQYYFDSQPAAIAISGFRLLCHPNAYLYRNYSPATATERFIDVKASRVQIWNPTLIAADGTTGVAIGGVHPDDESYTCDWGVLFGVRAYGTSGNYWSYDLYLDGESRAGSTPGIRDWDVIACHWLDVATANIRVAEGINVNFYGGGFYQGSFGAVAGKAIVTGSSGHKSFSVNFGPGRWSGTIAYEWTDGGTVNGKLDTALTIDANSDRIGWGGASGTFVVTDNSSTSSGFAGSQAFNRPGLLDLRYSGGAQAVYHQRLDTHGDNAALSDFRAFGKSDAAATVTYAQLRAFAAQDADGAEYGEWRFEAMVNGTLTQQVSVGDGVSLGAATKRGTGSLAVDAPVFLKSYTVATLPSAAVAGGNIYVSDEDGGAVPAFSDGTNWRRVTDRAVVS